MGRDVYLIDVKCTMYTTRIPLVVCVGFNMKPRWNLFDFFQDELNLLSTSSPFFPRLPGLPVEVRWCELAGMCICCMGILISYCHPTLALEQLSEYPSKAYWRAIGASLVE